jgi:hypothetical protein
LTISQKVPPIVTPAEALHRMVYRAEAGVQNILKY